MDKPSWLTQMKENTRATWPFLIIAALLSCLIIINICIFYLSDQSQNKVEIFITFNGILIGLMLVAQGVNYMIYKEHYHQMANKYNMQSYIWVTKYAIVWIIFGIVIISITIGEWFAFS
jgi:hypothetical protein